MAEKKQSKIRYDDFIANVQPDPAKPAATTMLSGFIGRGQEGHARIYPDPSLSTWYDIPEDDIVHSMPIADSKLGGSHIWVKADAQIKPGSAAAAQPAAITPQPTPATHCFICPPPGFTQPVVCGVLPPSVGCTQDACAAGVQARVGIHPTLRTPDIIAGTHWAGCQTLATDWFQCHTRFPGCTAQICFQGGVQAAALPHTAATVCTQFGCPGPFTPATVCPTARCGVFNPFGG